LEAVGDGKFIMQFCEVSRNHAANLGGGVLLGKTTPSTIIGSIIAQNSADFDGGGILSASPLELRTTKIIGNTTGTKGGGISSSDSLSLNFCTVSGNIAADAGSGIFSTERVSLKWEQSRRQLQPRWQADRRKGDDMLPRGLLESRIATATFVITSLGGCRHRCAARSCCNASAHRGPV
jgi:predicted outer membrane repeat protein